MARAVLRGTVRTITGRAVWGASVQVRVPDTTTPTPATLYADATGLTELTNPLTTDRFGRFLAYLDAPARVDLRISGPDINTEILPDVDTEYDASEPLPGTTGHYAETIGDGADTDFLIFHGLGTLDVAVQVYEVATGEKVYPGLDHTSVEAVTLHFSQAPTVDQFRVVVLG